MKVVVEGETVEAEQRWSMLDENVRTFDNEGREFLDIRVVWKCDG